jgi:hypothetical protein
MNLQEPKQIGKNKNDLRDYTVCVPLKFWIIRRTGLTAQTLTTKQKQPQ